MSAVDDDRAAVAGWDTTPAPHGEPIPVGAVQPLTEAELATAPTWPPPGAPLPRRTPGEHHPAAVAKTPGEVFRETLIDRWTARGRCVDGRKFSDLPEVDRADLEAAVNAAFPHMAELATKRERERDEARQQADTARAAMADLASRYTPHPDAGLNSWLPAHVLARLCQRAGVDVPDAVAGLVQAIDAAADEALSAGLDGQ